MNPRTRNRLWLLLIVALFAAPLLAAYLLNARGWRPAGMRNYGELVEPPRDLRAARFILADGSTLAWEDADWSWTLFALASPGCAAHCLTRLDELRRVRLTLNQNATRVRVVVLGVEPVPAAFAQLAPLQAARDADAHLAPLTPAQPDDVAAALVDPHGYLILRYAAGYDADRLRKDIARLLK
jgi:hypothetical protein